jgi:predicted amidohydrolase
MKGEITRRTFIQSSVAGAASVTSSGLVSGEPAIKSSRAAVIPQQKTKPGETIRVATIQSNRVPDCDNAKTDPFSDGFNQNELLLSIERRISWYEGLFDKAGKEKCNLAVITEDFTRLSSSMTFSDDPSIFRSAVEKQTSMIPERFGKASRKNSMFIVACYFALEGDRIFNVADLFGRQGQLVGRYRKVHLPQYEKWQVSTGDEFPAFETELGWIGMLICYDQMWPESAACCAMNGAQIICQPSAAILKDYHMRTRAMDNQVHHISSTHRNSMIVSPRADILANAQAQDPAVVWADVDLNGSTKSDEYFYESLYSGILDHKERHLKFRQPSAYTVLTEEHPPLANQYPVGGVADTPQAVEKVYTKHKEMRQKGWRGEQVPYHWRW